MEDARAYQELRVGFTAAVSHELRTPLARLLALLDSATLPGADRDELLAQAREQVEQMTELVNDVLFLSELESGREVVALGGTEVLPVLEEVRDRLADSAENAAITIHVDAAPGIELPLRRRMLQTVVENLAQNSVREAGSTHRVGRDGGYRSSAASPSRKALPQLAMDQGERLDRRLEHDLGNRLEEQLRPVCLTLGECPVDELLQIGGLGGLLGNDDVGEGAD